MKKVSEENNDKCTALVRVESGPATLGEALEEYRDRKREELITSLRSGIVNDPVTMAVFGMTAFKLLAVTAVSVGVGLASSAVIRAMTPRQKLERGRMTSEYVPRNND